MYFQALMMMGQAYASRRNNKREAAGGSRSNIEGGFSAAQRLSDLKDKADENNKTEELLSRSRMSDDYIKRRDSKFLDENKYY